MRQNGGKQYSDSLLVECYRWFSKDGSRCMIVGDFIFQYLRIKLTMLDGATSAEMFFRSAVANKCQLNVSECNNGSKEHFYL